MLLKLLWFGSSFFVMIHSKGAEHKMIGTYQSRNECWYELFRLGKPTMIKTDTGIKYIIKEEGGAVIECVRASSS